MLWLFHLHISTFLPKTFLLLLKSQALYKYTYADTNSPIINSSNTRGTLLALTSKIYLLFRLLTKGTSLTVFKCSLACIFVTAVKNRCSPLAAPWVTCADAVILLCSCTLCKYTSTILLHFLKGTVSHLTQLACFLGDDSNYKIINNINAIFFLYSFLFSLHCNWPQQPS